MNVMMCDANMLWVSGVEPVACDLCVCPVVACPANSNGVGVGTGCSCNAGYDGSVVASSVSPYYVSTCSGTYCMLFTGYS